MPFILSRLLCWWRRPRAVSRSGAAWWHPQSAPAHEGAATNADHTRQCHRGRMHRHHLRRLQPWSFRMDREPTWAWRLFRVSHAGQRVACSIMGLSADGRVDHSGRGCLHHLRSMPCRHGGAEEDAIRGHSQHWHCSTGCFRASTVQPYPCRSPIGPQGRRLVRHQ